MPFLFTNSSSQVLTPGPVTVNYLIQGGGGGAGDLAGYSQYGLSTNGQNGEVKTGSYTVPHGKVLVASVGGGGIGGFAVKHGYRTPGNGSETNLSVCDRVIIPVATGTDLGYTQAEYTTPTPHNLAVNDIVTFKSSQNTTLLPYYPNTVVVTSVISSTVFRVAGNWYQGLYSVIGNVTGYAIKKSSQTLIASCLGGLSFENNVTRPSVISSITEQAVTYANGGIHLPGYDPEYGSITAGGNGIVILSIPFSVFSINAKDHEPLVPPLNAGMRAFISSNTGNIITSIPSSNYVIF